MRVWRGWRGGGGGGGGARGGGDAADAGVAGVAGAVGAVGAAEGGVVCWRAGRYNRPRWPQPISSAALAPARAAEAARSSALAARAAIVGRGGGYCGGGGGFRHARQCSLGGWRRGALLQPGPAAQPARQPLAEVIDGGEHRRNHQQAQQ